MSKPFALELYERFTNGESAEQLSVELGIPLDRIEMRLRAADLYLKLRQASNKSEPALAGQTAQGSLLPLRAAEPKNNLTA